MRKGLIFREFYLIKNTLIIVAVTNAVIMILGILVRMSMDFGNLAKLEAESFKELDSATRYIFPVIPAVFISASFSLCGNITGDFKSNWMRYSYTFPVSAKEQVLTKYIVIFSGLFSSVVISTVNLAVFCSVSHRKFDTFVMKIIVIVCVVWNIGIIFETLLTYILKSKVKVQATGMAVFTLIYFSSGIGVLFYIKSFFAKRGFDIFNDSIKDSNITNKEFEEMWHEVSLFIHRATYCIPFVLIAFYVILFFLTVKAVERREK